MNLTRPHRSTLEWISRESGALAEWRIICLGVRSRMVLNRLIEAGYVEQCYHPTDTIPVGYGLQREPAIALRITDAGRTALSNHDAAAKTTTERSA